ncbi:MAG: serine/threonine-protein kinase, partial [Acidobacteriota bacterium]
MAQALPHPEHIGRYQIVAEIGRGSMGRVYLAIDPVIERRVALKVMAPRVDFNPEEWEEMQERFLLEARAAGRLKHPGVVTVFDADRDRNSSIAYIAMELIEGQSLQDLIASHAPLDPDQAFPIIEQVALALHAAHDQGLVHRDVKPANILIDGNGSAKLTDFGITKFRTHTLTAAGTVLGSPSYMSPEQVRGDEIDGRADLFALGVVLYECMTGVLPFAGDSIATVTYKILETDPLAENRIESSLSRETLEVVKRAIAKDPRERYQSGYEFAQALRAAGNDSPAPRGPRGTRLLAAGSVGQARSEMPTLQPGSSPPPLVSSRYLGWLLAGVVALSLAVGIPAYRTHSPAADDSIEPIADSTPTQPTSERATRVESGALEPVAEVMPAMELPPDTAATVVAS